MKVTWRPETIPVKLITLNNGDVFFFPNDIESTYMIIDKEDVFLDSNQIKQNMCVFIDIKEGNIYTARNDAEVIELHGSFVISEK